MHKDHFPRVNLLIVIFSVSALSFILRDDKSAWVSCASNDPATVIPRMQNELSWTLPSQCLHPQRIKCSGSLIYTTLTNHPSINFSLGNQIQDGTRQSIDISIEFRRDGLLAMNQYNPNHFTLDQWSGIMYVATNCEELKRSSKSRVISLPSLGLVENMTECLSTLTKADPKWQISFKTHGYGTRVAPDNLLSDSELELVRSKCSLAHTFSYAFSYLTGMFLAGPQGSVRITTSDSPAWLSQQDQQEKDKAAPPKLHLVVDHEDRGVFRDLFISSSSAGPSVPRNHKEKSIFCLVKFMHRIIAGSYGKRNERLTNPKASSRNGQKLDGKHRKPCRVVLYTRNDSSSLHTRKWEDALEMKRELRSIFQDSSIVLLQTMPSRFADQVLLFSGIDVFIAVHGGWGPNAMFLQDPVAKVVIESPQNCRMNHSGAIWLRSFQNVLGFQLHRIQCKHGSFPGSQLLMDSLPDVINALSPHCS